MRIIIIAFTIVLMIQFSVGIAQSQEFGKLHQNVFSGHDDQIVIDNHPKDPPVRDLSPDDLDDFILETMEQANIPGLSACIVRHGRVVWTGNYGWANIAEEVPITENTIFRILSISKTVTTAALMQLWENDEFELDDDINDYLPFEVIHPDFPDTPISFLMLLTCENLDYG